MTVLSGEGGGGHQKVVEWDHKFLGGRKTKSRELKLEGITSLELISEGTGKLTFEVGHV